MDEMELKNDSAEALEAALAVMDSKEVELDIRLRKSADGTVIVFHVDKDGSFRLSVAGGEHSGVRVDISRGPAAGLALVLGNHSHMTMELILQYIKASLTSEKHPVTFFRAGSDEEADKIIGEMRAGEEVRNGTVH